MFDSMKLNFERMAVLVLLLLTEIFLYRIDFKVFSCNLYQLFASVQLKDFIAMN